MSSSPSPIMRGYLVLADISGYTSYLAGVELDHAQEILADLIETILRRFKPLLTIHKIEGDAVFGYLPDARLIRGETLLELVESTYCDFRERLKNVRRHTTCTCRACQSIPMLDLKFIVHHGDFVRQHIGGTLELAGSDVNLAHRLLKNHVAEATGWHAYALFTAVALECMAVRPENLVEGAESYEHLGQVVTYSMDMHLCYESRMQARRVVVEDEQAFLIFGGDLPAPSPVVWDWLNDPEKRRLISGNPHGLQFVPVLRPGGRTAAGAITHCVHGKGVAMRETVLDWKPFDYFTAEQDSGPLGIVQTTFWFQPLEQGQRTRLRVALAGRLGRLPAFLARPLMRFVYTRILNYPSIGVRLRGTLNHLASEPDPTVPESIDA